MVKNYWKTNKNIRICVMMATRDQMTQKAKKNKTKVTVGPLTMSKTRTALSAVKGS